jgi:hypothetical protein
MYTTSGARRLPLFFLVVLVFVVPLVDKAAPLAEGDTFSLALNEFSISAGILTSHSSILNFAACLYQIFRFG